MARGTRSSGRSATDNRAIAAYQTDPKELRRLGLKYEADQCDCVRGLLDRLARAGDDESQLPPTEERINQCWLVCTSGDAKEFKRRLRRQGVQEALDFADAEFIHPSLRDRRRDRRLVTEFPPPKPPRNPPWVTLWNVTVGFVWTGILSVMLKGANDGEGSF